MGNSQGRGRRFCRALALPCLGAFLLLVGPMTFLQAGAAFTGATSDTGNSVASGSVAPPTGFAAGQTCTVSTVTFRNQTSTSSTNGTLALSTPAGVVANDLLLAHVTNRYDAGYTITPPAGWTLIDRTTRGAGANSVTSAVYWKLAGASEAATQSFVMAGGSGIDMAGGIAAYSGVSTSSPINTSGVAVGSSFAVTTASVTTTVANTVLVHAVTKRGEAQPALSGTTQRWSLLSPTVSTNQGSTVGDVAAASAGATATRTSTGSTGFEWIAQTVALRPPNPIPSASLTWTASSSSGASGYQLERVVAGVVTRSWSVTPISSTSSTDGTLTNGTTYTYRLTAYVGTWVSTTVTATLTPSC
jgi:hypothetical protein